MTEKFDWADEEAVVLPRADPIAVYQNPAGDVVIRTQQEHDEDVWIVIPRHAADQIADAIRRVAREEIPLSEEFVSED